MSGPHQLVVIDDEPSLITLLEVYVRTDPRFDLVASFLSARDALNSPGIDLQPTAVISDVEMPGMSGLEALPAMRRLWVDSVIVLFTASRDEADGAIALGADAVVDKATPISELLDLVARLVDDRSAR